MDWDYWGWILMAVAIAGAVGVYVWNKGLLGTANEARLKELRDKAKAEVEKLEARLADAVARREAKEKLAVEKAAAQLPEEEMVYAEKDKATRIAENKALLDSGIITQAEFQAAKEKILVE